MTHRCAGPILRGIGQFPMGIRPPRSQTRLVAAFLVLLDTKNSVRTKKSKGLSLPDVLRQEVVQCNPTWILVLGNCSRGIRLVVIGSSTHADADMHMRIIGYAASSTCRLLPRRSHRLSTFPCKFLNISPQVFKLAVSHDAAEKPAANDPADRDVC